MSKCIALTDFFFSSRRRHTRYWRDWSSDVCSSDLARAGAAMGCKEALFTLGDRPEDRWPVASSWLEAHGFDSTLAYLRAMAIRVLEETGLLPHLNPGDRKSVV